MGSSASKPETGASPHVWKGSGPTSVSQNIVESLQSSTEANKRLPIHQTDASRAQTLELHIQARVAEELKKLQAKEAEAFKKAQEKLSELSEKDVKGQLSSPAVSKEVEALRKKLEERKQVRQLPESVETARSDVIRCLREHDRRPLDCWQEVENFKEEVRRLEKVWVDKVVS